MKRQVLFVQGGGEDVHDSWDNHLADSLRRELGDDYGVTWPQTLRFTLGAKLDGDNWVPTITVPGMASSRERVRTPDGSGT